MAAPYSACTCQFPSTPSVPYTPAIPSLLTSRLCSFQKYRLCEIFPITSTTTARPSKALPPPPLGRRMSHVPNFAPVNLPSFTPAAPPTQVSRSESLPLTLEFYSARPSAISRSTPRAEADLRPVPRRAATLGRAVFGSGSGKNATTFLPPSFTPGGDVDLSILSRHESIRAWVTFSLKPTQILRQLSLSILSNCLWGAGFFQGAT